MFAQGQFSTTLFPSRGPGLRGAGGRDAAARNALALGGAPRVMVIEDVQNFRELVGTILKHNGFQVTSASNGREALLALDICLPELIILDIEMPELDGLTFLEALHRNTLARNIPVILLTAHPKREYIERAAALGVRQCLVKANFNLKELAACVKSILDLEKDID